MALYDINQNGVQDAFFLLPNTGPILYYMIAWDLDEIGTPKTWTSWRGGWSLSWPTPGAGVALHDINGNGIVDAYFLLVADLAFEDLYYFRLARDLGTDGYFQGTVDTTNRGGWGTGAWDVTGGGVALANLGGGSRIDALMMIVDQAAGDDLYKYRVAYDLQNSGAPRTNDPLSSVRTGPSAGGWKTAGGDVALLDLNGNGRMEGVFVASVTEIGTGKSEYRYRIAWDFSSSTNDFSWGPIKGFERVWTGPTSTAVGLAYGSLNGNSNARDFLFAATGDKGGFRIVFRPAFDMNSNGDIPLK